MNRTIIPSAGVIFAKQLEASTVTKSGFHKGAGDIEEVMQAEVLDTGAGVEAALVGKTILYKDYAATETELDGEKYLLLLQEDVLGHIVTVDEKKEVK